MADQVAAVTKKFAAMRQAFTDGLKDAGEAYANGLYRAKPIVYGHFTAGNQQRYGWAPLSRAYFLRKQAGISHAALRSGHTRGSKLDKHAEFSSSTGELTGIGSATNLPMLVLTGALREAITGRTAVVTVDQDGNIHLHWTGLPDYAVYHHEGVGNLPKRSPVEPNAEDREMVIMELRKFLDRRFAKTGGLARVGEPLPR